MVREVLAQIEPIRLTETPHGRPASPRKSSWLTVGLVAVAGLVVIGHAFDSPELSSFVSTAVVVLLVAGAAYVALAGELGDETTRWRTSSIFTVVTVGVVYALYLSHPGNEPAVEPESLAMAVLVGFCAASAYGQMVARERGEKWSDTALRRIRTSTAEAFDARFPFPSAGGVVWAIDPSCRALRAITADSDRSFVWDEPIRAVALRRVRWAAWSSHVFDCELSIRSGREPDNEWTYVFEFPGTYRDTAGSWHDVFAGWMIDDKRKGEASS